MAEEARGLRRSRKPLTSHTPCIAWKKKEKGGVEVLVRRLEERAGGWVV
jgi:hypothetical protein